MIKVFDNLRKSAEGDTFPVRSQANFTIQTCFQNVHITGMDVMASGFRMLLGLCSAPQDFQFLLLSPTYVNGHVLQVTLYTMPFNCSFFSWSLGFLKTFPNF